MLSDNYKYPVYHGGLDPLGMYSEKNRDANSVMIINVGASAGTIGYSFVDFWSSDGCYCLSKTDEANSRYLYYALLKQEKQIQSKVRHAGIPTLDAKVVADTLVPIPPFDKQNEVIKTLGTFENTIQNIKDEIRARQKQYEYYKDKILSF